MRKTGRIYTTAALAALLALSVGCGQDKGGDDKASNSTDPGIKNGDDPTAPAPGMLAISLTADGLASSIDGAALNLAGVADEAYGYPGIGMNYGDAIVEGMRIQLRKVDIQTVNSETGGYATSVNLVSFGEEGKTLEISEGFNGKIETSAEVTVAPGTYSQAAITIDNSLSLKAYAYLDRNNDGTIDATVWTTATEVKIDTTKKLAPGAMPGYDWYTYPWLLSTIADSLTDNTSRPATMITQLSKPVIVTDKGVETDGVVDQKLSISLLVDTFRIVKVWDGRFQLGNFDSWVSGSGDASIIPSPVFPFPYSDNDTRVMNGNLKIGDFYPVSKPAFALNNMVSAYAFINKTSVKAQNYLVSKTADITPYNNQLMTVLLDDDGSPMFAKFGLGESNGTLHIGAMGKVFAKQADSTYTFATSYGMKDAGGKWDGGLMSSDDLDKAGHLFSGFRKLAIGQRAEMKMNDGKRCKEEYDYCVGTAGVAAYFMRAQ